MNDKSKIDFLHRVIEGLEKQINDLERIVSFQRIEQDVTDEMAFDVEQDYRNRGYSPHCQTRTH